MRSYIVPMGEIIEIMDGDYQGRIGELVECCPLFATVRLIVGGISTNIIEVS